MSTTTPARPGALPPSPPTSIPRLSDEDKAHYQAQENGTGNAPRRPPPPPQAVEDQLHQHHRVLKGFLAPTIAAQGQAAKTPSRARDKLLRLSPVQFQELSTDVYDELLRRQDQQRAGGAHGWTVPNFLLPKPNYHPKRNQARQKLSSLVGQKFSELAMDVYYELERRFPKLEAMEYGRMPGPPGGSAGPNGTRGSQNPNFNPRPRQGAPPPINAQAGPRMRSSSNSSPLQPYSPSVFDNRSQPGSSPNDYDGRQPPPRAYRGLSQKSSMVNINESALDDQNGYDPNSPVPRPRRRSTKSNISPMQLEHVNAAQKAHLADLERKIYDLESQLRLKDHEVEQSRNLVTEKDKTVELERAKAATLAADLEKQVQSATHLNSSLESELDKLRISNLALQNEAMSKQRSSTNDSTATETQYRARYEALERDYAEQKRVTEHVRQEAYQSLQEMITLSQRSNQAAEVEESLLKQIADLEASVTLWKDRYHKAKSSSPSPPTTSTTAPTTAALIPRHHTLPHPAFTSPSGLVQASSMHNFNASIDDLLRLSRTADPADALEHMRTIVSCVRAITEDIDMSTAAAGTAAPDLRKPKLRARVTAAANALITAAKTFAAAKGLAPVALLDAAAGALVAAVVDLVQVVRIRPPLGAPPVGAGVVNGPFVEAAPVRAGGGGSGGYHPTAVAAGGSGVINGPYTLSDEPPNDDGEVDLS